MSQPTCKTCVYWVRGHKDLGSCHRNPPQIAADQNGAADAHWPFTAEHDYCGQHDRFVKWMLDERTKDGDVQKPG